MAPFSVLFSTFLLATSNNRRRSSSSSSNSQQTNNSPPSTGRGRYDRGGTKKPNSNNNRKQDVYNDAPDVLHPIPELTSRNGPRPSYYTCRHTYEDTLIAEIGSTCVASSPYPGLVRVEPGSSISELDPVYALQSIPNGIVTTGESIKSIARAVHAALLEEDAATCSKLRAAPRGSLAIHALVPGMCKGQTKPLMLPRTTKIAEELRGLLSKSYPAARKKATANDGGTIASETERWLLQIMLQSPTICVASLVQCQHVGPGYDAYWPNWIHPLGLARVDIEGDMPSSAYRKLLEALECLQMAPTPTKGNTNDVIDLGASPGGWTAALRKLGCNIVAVDRSPLDTSLMQDDKVTFVKGDAFTYAPPQRTETQTRSPPDSWMVSDVIAYPERATELLERWCMGHWAQYLIITVKFQGQVPAFDDLDNAIATAKRHGYHCRAKHFFNNKNEVTLMAWEESASNNERKEVDDDEEANSQTDLLLGESFYPAILPKR